MLDKKTIHFCVLNCKGRNLSPQVEMRALERGIRRHVNNIVFNHTYTLITHTA